MVSDASRLNYGQALLSKTVGPDQNGQPALTANDTSILLGRLDSSSSPRRAGQQQGRRTVRLGYGRILHALPGVRVNQQTTLLQAGDMSGYASSYEVKFSDTTAERADLGRRGGQRVPNAPRDQRNQRWFVVWLGTGKDPIDQAAAKTLADPIRPYTPPPHRWRIRNARRRPERAAAGSGWTAPAGVPVPVETPVPEMMPAG